MRNELLTTLDLIWSRWSDHWDLPAISLASNGALAPRHYEIQRTSRGSLVIRAADEAGFRDGMARAFGLSRRPGAAIPGYAEKAALSIRGLHLDLRCQIPMDSWLLELPDRLAQLGLNVLWIEWEGSFPYRSHLQIREPDAFSPETVQAFLERCAELGIETVPVLQCFAHLEYILHRPAYHHLELPSARKYYTLNPASDWKPLFRDLLEELVEVHSSTYIHVGGDEVIVDKETEDEALERYLAHLHEVNALAGEFGKKSILWADVLTRNPRLARQLPSGLQLADWDYYTPVSECWPSPPSERFPIFREGADSFVLCPAVRGYPDNHRWIDWHTHRRNVQELAQQAQAHAADGVVITSWAHTSDFNERSAHRIIGEIVPRSRRMHFDAAWPLLAWGAAAMWNPESPAAGHILPEAFTPGSLEAIYERLHPVFHSKTPVIQPMDRLTEAERRELVQNVPPGHEILNRCLLIADELRGLAAAKLWTGRAAFDDFSQALGAAERSFKRNLRGWLLEAEIETEWIEVAGYYDDLRARLAPVFGQRTNGSSDIIIPGLQVIHDLPNGISVTG